MPHRLARQLVNLEKLEINDIPDAPNVHFSTWLLYGSAFHSVKDLKIEDVQFPSFKDFLRFVKSFRALWPLHLSNISFASPGVSLKFPQSLSTTKLYLMRVQFPSFDIFLRFVVSFRDLDLLILSDISFAHPGVPVQFPQLPRVGTLQLFRDNFPSFENFICFITSFRALDDLYLSRTSHAFYLGRSPNTPRIPNMVALTLDQIQFPSFEVFIHLITSFSALRELELRSISCAQAEAPPTILQFPCTLNQLENLALLGMHQDDGNFLGQFSQWILSGGCVIQRVEIDPGAGLHPSGYLLLEGIRMHIQVLILTFLSEGKQRPLQSFLGE